MKIRQLAMVVLTLVALGAPLCHGQSVAEFAQGSEFRYTKGTIDVQVLSEMIAKRQKALAKEILHHHLLQENAGPLSRNILTDRLLDQLLNSPDPKKITHGVYEYAMESFVLAMMVSALDSLPEFKLPSTCSAIAEATKPDAKACSDSLQKTGLRAISPIIRIILDPQKPPAFSDSTKTHKALLKSYSANGNISLEKVRQEYISDLVYVILRDSSNWFGKTLFRDNPGQVMTNKKLQRAIREKWKISQSIEDRLTRTLRSQILSKSENIRDSYQKNLRINLYYEIKSQDPSAIYADRIITSFNHKNPDNPLDINESTVSAKLQAIKTRANEISSEITANRIANERIIAELKKLCTKKILNSHHQNDTKANDNTIFQAETHSYPAHDQSKFSLASQNVENLIESFKDTPISDTYIEVIDSILNHPFHNTNDIQDHVNTIHQPQPTINLSLESKANTPGDPQPPATPNKATIDNQAPTELSTEPLKVLAKAIDSIIRDSAKIFNKNAHRIKTSSDLYAILQNASSPKERPELIDSVKNALSRFATKDSCLGGFLYEYDQFLDSWVIPNNAANENFSLLFLQKYLPLLRKYSFSDTNTKRVYIASRQLYQFITPPILQASEELSSSPSIFWLANFSSRTRSQNLAAALHILRTDDSLVHKIIPNGIARDFFEVVIDGLETDTVNDVISLEIPKLLVTLENRYMDNAKGPIKWYPVLDIGFSSAFLLKNGNDQLLQMASEKVGMGVELYGKKPCSDAERIESALEPYEACGSRYVEKYGFEVFGSGLLYNPSYLKTDPSFGGFYISAGLTVFYRVGLKARFAFGANVLSESSMRPMIQAAMDVPLIDYMLELGKKE